ncbi:unnamed protein product [Owenia fusiformis]|uniref:Uncharacterized protein n=1 Tax=Owenia fusiformis TaxID=6347 RepID=A0A8J1XFV0_OWEFU|nr:unnamed protein product [Owenia fusiformis]
MNVFILWTAFSLVVLPTSSEIKGNVTSYDTTVNTDPMNDVHTDTATTESESTNTKYTENGSIQVQVERRTNDTTERPRGRSVVPTIPKYIVIATTFFYVLIFLVGVLGNILVIFVVSKNPDMKSSTNFFLVNLSIADLLVLIIAMPPSLVDVYSRDVWYFGEVMCKAIPFLEWAVTNASVLTILAISFERYYAICKPLKAQYTCTFARMIKTVIFIWLTALIVSSPFAIIPEEKDTKWLDGTPIKACRFQIKETWMMVYIVFSTCVLFALPFVILLVLYSVISRQLMTDSNLSELKADTSHTSCRARKQVVLMLFMVVIMYFICMLPQTVIRLWIATRTNEQLRILGLERYTNLIYSCRGMFYLNSSINPVLYNIMSTKFREAFMVALGFRKRGFYRRGTIVTTLSNTGMTVTSHRDSVSSSQTGYYPGSSVKNSRPSQTSLDHLNNGSSVQFKLGYKSKMKFDNTRSTLEPLVSYKENGYKV